MMKGKKRSQKQEQKVRKMGEPMKACVMIKQRPKQKKGRGVMMEVSEVIGGMRE